MDNWTDKTLQRVFPHAALILGTDFHHNLDKHFLENGHYVKATLILYQKKLDLKFCIYCKKSGSLFLTVLD